MGTALKFIGRWLKGKFMSPSPDTAVVELPQQRALPETQEEPPPVSPVQPEPALRQSPKERLGKECDDIGLKTARDSWKCEPDETDLKSLDARADSRAKETWREPSEQREENQRERLKGHENTVKRRRAELDAAFAHLRQARQNRAKLGPLPPYPTVKAIFRQGGVLALTFAFAPTLQAISSGLPAVLSWVLATIVALGISLFIVHGILPPAEPSEIVPSRQQKTVRAALLLGVGFFFIRLWAAGVDDFLLTAALTVVEISAVLFLEDQAKRLAVQIAAWLQRVAEIGKADSWVEEAERQTADRQALLNRAVAERRELLHEIEDDWALRDLKTLTSIARDAIRSGYLRGIAANAGEISGMGRMEAIA